MMEGVSKVATRRLLRAGVTLSMIRSEGSPGAPLPGIFDRWAPWGRICHLTLRVSHDDPLPRTGDQVRIQTQRLDGLFQIGGIVREVEFPQASEGKRRAVRASLKIDHRSASRLQRRAFFRLPGHWPAEIRLSAPSETIGFPQRPLPVMIHDLSAGGMLLSTEQPDSLSLGHRFAVTLDLQDGAAPLAADAEVVRRQESRLPGGTPSWGCRFRNLGDEAEQRIIHQLHTLYRLRLSQDSHQTLLYT